MRYIIILTLLTCVNVIFAQEVKILNTFEISTEPVNKALFPKFSADDQEVIFSSENYKGLYRYDLVTKSFSVITEEAGAGYNPLVLDDETILYRTTKYKKGRKFHSLFSKDLKTNNETELVREERNLRLPNQHLGNNILYRINDHTEAHFFSSDKLLKGQATKAVYSENSELRLIEEDRTTILNPLGKGVYVWESLSPDGNKVMFTFGGKGTYICDLEGNILDHIAEAHYPRFSPDGKFISYMVDIDNGYNYVSSDIFVYSLSSKESFQITNTNDQIEMFAEWSNDSSQLVYHTIEGKIIISTLEFEN